MSLSDYQAKLQQEQEIYEQNEKVHNLPEIFHYWSNKYVLPQLQAVGIRGSQELFADAMAAQCDRNPNARFVSLGAGNCDLEIDLAQRLRMAGHEGFSIDCLDLNETMLERGRVAATQQGVAKNVEFLSGDFNQWEPVREYDAVIAIQALHHVLNLEGLFAAVRRCLTPKGVFVVSDIIGRNGHLRWPEALDRIYEIWRRLPPSYRYNHQLRRYEEWFLDWDCSTEGFEGIRSQDILRLLVEHFEFEKFVAFGNLIDPFVDRSFGHNFDLSKEWDRAFIDDVEALDREEMIAGRVKPTHMFAILSRHADQLQCHLPLTPEFCVRDTSLPERVPETPTAGPYAWDWPHDPQSQVGFLARQLATSEAKVEAMTGHYRNLFAEYEERTNWALSLNRDIDALNQRIEGLHVELHDRTDWALSLDRELQNRTLGARVKRLLGR